MMMGQAEALEASAEAAGCPILVVDPDAPEIIEGGPVLIDGREPRGTFDGTPYEPEAAAEPEG